MTRRSTIRFISVCLCLIMVSLLSGVWAVFPVQKASAQGIPTNTRGTAAANIIVTNNADSGPGSLRQAIADISAGSTITFTPTLAGQTITLASELLIEKNLTIDGSGLNPKVAISGNNAGRIFNIGKSLTTSIKSLVLENGLMTSSGNYTDYGGAILVDLSSTLSIDHVTFSKNQSYEGGAIFIPASASVTILNSEFDSNSSQTDGGAIYIISRGDLTVEYSVFTNNSSADGGGAIVLDSAGTRLLEYNTFSNNTARTGGAIQIIQTSNSQTTLEDNLFSGNISSSGGGAGGALYISQSSLPATLSMVNNTFYANQSGGVGGAIYTYGTATMENNTFSNNQANLSGGNGGASLYLSAPASTTLYNNLLTNNTGGGECVSFGSVVTTGSNNFVGDGSATCLPILTGNPLLGPLADNGGFTQTMALLPGSPAIDAGNDTPSCPSTDQRGVIRPQGAHCDIGAFELVQYVISGNAGVAGAILSYTDGTPKTATANGSGNYSFSISSNWSGTVTPSEAGYIFSPVNRTYTNVTSNLSSQNYTATQAFHISGNAGVAGAILNYTGGFTDANGSGNYTITVPISWSGTVTPFKCGYNFSPTNRPYTNISADQTGQDYTATPFTTCWMIFQPLVIH